MSLKFLVVRYYIFIREYLITYVSIENMIMVTIETYATSSERRVASPHPKSPNGHEYVLNCIMASRGTTEIGTLNIRYLNSGHCKILSLASER